MIERYTFTDSRGITIATTVPILEYFTGGIHAALQDCSAASLDLIRRTYSLGGEASPQGPSAYATVGDVAVFAFQGAGGHGVLQVQVPAPINALFLGDAETVDPVATEAAALIAAVQSLGRMPSGVGVGNYIWGYRRKLTERKY